MVMGIEIIDPLEKYLFVIILTRIQDTLRNPLIAKFLFNINDLNRQRDALVEREINRQKEIQDAERIIAQREVWHNSLPNTIRAPGRATWPVIKR